MRIRAFQAVHPNFDLIASTDSFFGSVKYEYPRYRKSGFFHRTPAEAIYIYQIEGNGRIYKGLVACSEIADYDEGLIKKHENTLSSKEQQQLQLIISRGATVKPILMTYPGVKQIDKLIDECIKDNKIFYKAKFEEENTIHSFWQISNGEIIEKFTNLFAKKVPETYIADGHHRCSTTSLLHKRMSKSKDNKDYDLLLTAFFPAHELDIHDYNRIVDGLGELSPTMFIAKLSRVFEIEPIEALEKPSNKFEVTMLFQKECYRLKWRESILKKYSKEIVVLDANLLDVEVLQNILDIQDIRTNTRIKYVEGPKGVEGIRQKTLKVDDRIGFLLYPVDLKDLMKVADANKVMPPKSTWFEPRMKNGFIVHEF